MQTETDRPPYEAYAVIAGSFLAGLGGDARPCGALGSDLQGLPHALARTHLELPQRSVLTPRFGRLLTWSLGAAGVNDFLHAGFKALCAKANQLEDDRSY